MKRLQFSVILIFSAVFTMAQGGNPSDFSIQGKLYANNPLNGYDDWFSATEAGLGVLDTTGAAGLYANSQANTSYIFTRRMKYPYYSVQNSKLFIDALFARDGNTSATDRTVMLGSKTKNGANPMTEWLGGAGSMGGSSNDIVDVYAHARRNGTGVINDLWVNGGVSFVGSGGTHYFDYEFYQSDITFTNPPLWSEVNFTNSGTYEGHTAWHFNASGNLISAGDLVVAVSYENNGINAVELRIWVKESDFNTINPSSFQWGSNFDKSSNGSQYGYASIVFPLSNFYYNINSWATPIPAAPWGTIVPGNVVSSQLSQYKFFEFAINFTGLGIDPKQIPGSDPCAPAFKKLLVKSRTGNAFTSDLKDFVGPYSFMDIPQVMVNAGPDQSICTGIDTLLLSTSAQGAYGSFHWTSANGTGIISNPDSSAIYVNLPGVYYVESVIYLGCSVGDKDTVAVLNSTNCTVLANNDFELKGKNSDNINYLSWNAANVQNVQSYKLEKSKDGYNYSLLAEVNPAQTGIKTIYTFEDKNTTSILCYYRIRAVEFNGVTKVSNVIKLGSTANKIQLSKLQGSNLLYFYSDKIIKRCALEIFDPSGKMVYHTTFQPSSYREKIRLSSNLNKGIYYYRIVTENNLYCGKLFWD
jgi:hypothetical protein